MYQQAQRFVDKFGGVPQAAAALNRDVSTIYKWLTPKDKGGTDGLIPSSALEDVLKAASKNGISLTSEDLDPREYPICQNINVDPLS